MPIQHCEFSEARAENLLAEAFRQAGWRVGEEPRSQLDLESFAVTSDGEIVDNPGWFRTAQKKLRVVQGHVSRCSKRSGGWRKGCRFVAQLHRHVCNQPNDFQHKPSRELVNHHGFIAVEAPVPKKLGDRLHNACDSGRGS